MLALKMFCSRADSLCYHINCNFHTDEWTDRHGDVLHNFKFKTSQTENLKDRRTGKDHTMKMPASPVWKAHVGAPFLQLEGHCILRKLFLALHYYFTNELFLSSLFRLITVLHPVTASTESL